MDFWAGNDEHGLCDLISYFLISLSLVSLPGRGWTTYSHFGYLRVFPLLEDGLEEFHSDGIAPSFYN